MVSVVVVIGCHARAEGPASANPRVAVQYWPVLDSVIVFIVRVHLCSTITVSIVCPRTVTVPIVYPSVLKLWMLG